MSSHPKLEFLWRLSFFYPILLDSAREFFFKSLSQGV